MDLRNNTILITGGSSGFGYEFAKKLLDLGNTVIVTGRNQIRLEETKKRLPAIHVFQSDLSDPASIRLLCENVRKQFPQMNLLINNAGEMRKLNLLDPSLDQDNVVREIEINLLGPVRMTQEFLPQLLSVKTAAILNVTSGLALIPFPIAPIYGATKSGLRSYTQSLRIQLKKTNIRVFELIAPGANTALNHKFKGLVANNSLMEPDKLVDIALKGIEKNRFEIYPGIATIIKLMSRLAPGLMLKQMGKLVEKAFYTKQPGMAL